MGKVTVQPLTMMINLLDLTDTKSYFMTILASTLAAVKAAMQELHSFYSQEQQQSAAAQRAAFLSASMPYPMADYRQATQMQGGWLLVFSAFSSTNNKPVVVRFMRWYGEAAHRAWAAAGQAPQLYRVVRLPGGWLQVEMEWLEAADGWQQLARVEEPAAVAAASAAAQAALQRAHSVQGSGGKCFAHGDMRARNVMVRRRAGGGGGDGSSEAEAYDVVFVDFECSGVDGEAVYPPFLKTSIEWPAEVDTDKPVRQQHDTELLARSVEQLRRFVRN